ncbi:hypothetical protein FSP39_006519 [Pinctada imbricata]|uniref:Centromere protein O n=1 Tax=Pinctada imbricata TaxID=66713 RepID=A0AA88XLC3_PINIB|nr:hypothetical protein FSP39_006519 [Pinctada imbricata]
MQLRGDATVALSILILHCFVLICISSIALDSNSDGNKITLRFETSHRNIVRESYFMELAQSDAGLTVCRHDLPCFVPLVHLEKEHLMTNTQLFLMHISDYLQAYVKRREEANLVKEILGEISCDLSMTLPADYIEIKIGGAEWSFALEVQMTYTNILKIIPTQVVMSLEFEEEEPEADQMRKWREHFKSQPLSVAMETVWLELRKFISAK